MTRASSTSGLRPARCAPIAAARPQGPPPTIRRSQSDDLVTTRSDADVRDRRLHHLVHAFEILPRLRRQILDATRVRGRALPPRHPLVLRLRALEHAQISRKLGESLAIELVAVAERNLG